MLAIKTEKNKRWLPKKVKAVLIIMLGIAIMMMGIRLIFGSDNPFYVIVSNSMAPALNKGDIIFVRHNSDDASSFAGVKTGDIIAFDQGFLNEKVIVSRIFSIQNNAVDGQNYRILLTKSDNPDWKAQDSVIAENFVGKVVYTIPSAARILEVLITPLPLIIITSILLFVVLRYCYSKKKSKKYIEMSLPSY
ncbi:MAG TPA: signal peptidase I [Nitrososphaeraceae archaeon]|nr:signal peptidase I [Nitrososphaeraceae archaeon]